MAEYTLRPARMDEAEQLATIKSNYIRSLYRGFLAAEYLRQASPEFYLPEVSWWMQDADTHVDVLEISGQVVGFIIYGADPTNHEYGLIREEAIEPAYGRRDKNALAQHAIDRLAALGYSTIRLWVLRDNFRVRFLFESIGFRADGTVRVEPRDNLELSISRYVYQVPAKGSGHALSASIE